MQWTAFSLKTKPNQRLAGKYGKLKTKKVGHFWKTDYSAKHFTSALTAAREKPKNKGKNPDKMCPLIFLKIFPQ